MGSHLANYTPSWPGLSRPSTSCLATKKKHVDARDKPGHYERGKCARSSDRLMHRHELGAVRKRRFHLDVMDHFGDALHALRAPDDLGAGFHQLGHGAAVAGALDDEV